MRLGDFEPKHVPGLYSFEHFETADGAWFQRSVDHRRSEITFCAAEGAAFQRFPTIHAFRTFLESQA